MFSATSTNRLSTLLFTAAVLLVPHSGCSRPTSSDDGVRVDMVVHPQPPVVGMVRVELRFTEPGGAPVSATAVRLEGNMNHAGMTPSFAEATEIEPGVHRADLELTMGGDWFVLVDAELSDGRRVEEKIDLPGVRLK